MEERIRTLDDATAIRILSTIAKVHQRPGAMATELTPELRQSLRQGFGVPAVAATVSEGELARQALLLLAAEPSSREALAAFIDDQRPAVRSFGVVETVAVVTAALVVLQTQVKIERDKDGKISWKFEKKAASNALLQELVRKVLSLKP